MQIDARDGGVPPRSSFTILEVDILDINDNSPEFGPGIFKLLLLQSI